VAPAPDAAPEALAGGTPEPLRSQLTDLLGADRVLARAGDLIRYASDASPYRIIPQAVVMAKETGDVAKVFAFGRSSGIPVTLRAAGTSLNGQGQSGGILIDVRRHFTGTEVLDGGARARVRPGTVLGHANRVLAPHGTRLGPDPASKDAACVGGVIANNSGGMRCGVTEDSYSTLESLSFTLASGTTIDTAAPGASAAFERAEPELARGLAEIRDEVRADAELAERVRHKFEIKNTMGYRLCAFLDAEEPVEIFRRLLVGAEGTLGFVGEAVFRTVPTRPHTVTAWIHFADIDAATGPVPDLVAAGCSAVELMVAPALIAAAYSLPGTPEYWKELDPASAALLVELRSDEERELDGLETTALEVIGAHKTILPPQFTRDEELTEVFWRVREGMHGIVGKMRPQGTALIIEDVCVPPARMAESAADISALLSAHGFLAGVAGHASAGNLHFMLTPDFAVQSDRDRYEAFMEELVDLVISKYDGSLKAEHGTGRNMAPYVEREWGAKATALMRRVKRLADPDGVLAPGVIFTDDPAAHMADLSTTPQVDESVDTCVECGICEPACPSRLLSTTPRQRIVLLREVARQPPGSALSKAILDDYEYDGEQTCAADGSCAHACPLGIDTGKMIKVRRAREEDGIERRGGMRRARHWSRFEQAARAALRFGGPLAARTRRGAATPKPAPRLPATGREGAAAVYMPACINRIFGNPRGSERDLSLPEAIVTASARAGMPVWIPGDVAGHCCGTPWHSKGEPEGHRWMSAHTAEALWRWSEEGGLPVVVDAGSCTNGILAEMPGSLEEDWAGRLARIEVIDSVAWAQRLLDRLEVPRKLGAVALHPTCSSRHIGVDHALRRLAGNLADEVFIPPSAGCCGFAGDRGFLYPELTDAATREQAAEVRVRSFDAHLSANRTCEIGMERATGRSYESFFFALEELTRPAAGQGR
jgi:D-lactate dehydrogenase